MNSEEQIITAVHDSALGQAVGHSLDAWEEQRERFTQLYFVEDKPLREVQAIMRMKYGLKAT